MIKCVNLLPDENSRCAVLTADYRASELNYGAYSTCCKKSAIDFSLHTDGSGKSGKLLRDSKL